MTDALNDDAIGYLVGHKCHKDELDYIISRGDWSTPMTKIGHHRGFFRTYVLPIIRSQEADCPVDNNARQLTWTKGQHALEDPNQPDDDDTYAALEIKLVAAANLYILKQHVAAVPIKGADGTCQDLSATAPA